MSVAERIPHYMRPGITQWITIGQPAGDFLMAVFRNDFFEACLQADDTNVLLLSVYATFLHQHAPRDCYGGLLKCKLWLETRREQGPIEWEWPGAKA